MITDARLAADIAQRAGELLLEVRAREAHRAGIELGRIGDGEANSFILDALAEHRPGDAVMSEESTDDRARLTADRVWIVDPLDGSREYGKLDRTDWAVHIALWERGRGLTACAVGQPSLEVVYCTDDVLGPTIPVRDHPKIIVSASRPPYFVDALAASVDGVVETMGSAGAKTMAVVRGDVDAYVHTGGQWEWDSAAPAGVAVAAGLHCSRIDGSSLLYNQSHPYLPDLLICRTELAQPMLDGIARFADRAVDSDRVALARDYIEALDSHDASHVRLADSCTFTRDGRLIAGAADDIRFGLEHPVGTGAVGGVAFTETGSTVTAMFRVTGDRISFTIPASVIESIDWTTD